MEIQVIDPIFKVTLNPRDIGYCKEQTCKKEFYWVTNPHTGKRMCISKKNDTGEWIAHFKDCTKPNKFTSNDKRREKALKEDSNPKTQTLL